MRIASLLTCAVLLSLAASGLSAEPQQKAVAPPKKTENFPGMIDAIRSTPGCLGVETAQTFSGKSVIFAWFENKKSLMKWYASDYHQEMMKHMDRVSEPGRKPLADVPDDAGPIMVVASITLGGTPTKEKPVPFKQIAIEIYQPLGSGISIGGKFAPEKMVVPPRAKK